MQVIVQNVKMILIENRTLHYVNVKMDIMIILVSKIFAKVMNISKNYIYITFKEI